jgi:MIP family channel proteins
MARTEAVRRNGMISFSFHAPATSVKAELAAADTRRALIGEFLGSLLFMILGAGTVILTGGMLGERLGSARLLVVALAQGLAFLLLVAAMLPISGGHLNPAVTFAMMLAKKMNPTRGGMYVVAQCVGAVAGALMLTLIIPHGTQGTLGAHGLGAGVSVAGGLTAEVVVTFMLVSAVLNATMGGSRPATLGLAAIGLTSVLGYLFAMPLTGASMNPARSLGPAFVSGAWKDHWIFWAGPLVGAMLAAVAHHSLARGNGRR